ncbi:hypothetical protein BS50DRAFT_635349 [Corynespora cassiicola Philippines]|uniref:BTB domain-containing protein n=1 Tax=Corynespora cassiicola Philippines TaxID=1448308 RepID=A0A2T2NMB9_CORCC|nr:hypothetical protein BS50DRAFT_635349 [Corynespora cassiicola Philippines]
MSRLAKDMGMKTVIICLENPLNGKCKLFTVHKGLLTRSHNIFRSMLRQHPDVDNVKLQLPHSRAFQLYVVWLYTDVVHVESLKTSFPSEWETNDRIWDMLFTAYVLGQEMLDVDFQDAIMDKILEYLTSGVKICRALLLQLINEAYKKCKGHDPLRLILTELAVWGLGDAEFGLLIGEKTLHPASFEDLSKKISERISCKDSKDPPYLKHIGSCHYHRHWPEFCYKNKLNCEGMNVEPEEIYTPF